MSIERDIKQIKKDIADIKKALECQCNKETAPQEQMEPREPITASQTA